MAKTIKHSIKRCIQFEGNFERNLIIRLSFASFSFNEGELILVGEWRPIETRSSKEINSSVHSAESTLRSTKMDVSTQSTESVTTILDLNDDCLREVFEFLNLKELTAAADVCTRFRQNAVPSARKKSKNLVLSMGSSWHDLSQLRNFGAFITCVNVYAGGICPKLREKIQKRFIELLNQYCTGESIDLNIRQFDITDEIALLLQSLLARVRKLEFYGCEISKLILQSLSIWSPELRELMFTLHDDEKAIPFESLRQCLPKLKFISFKCNSHITNIDIEEILKQNLQLKQIEILLCEKLGDNILPLIAKYVPDIESLNLTLSDGTGRDNIQCFGQLRKLKSLFLGKLEDLPYILSVLQELASKSIPLETLSLGGFLLHNTHDFIDTISNLQQLKSLEIRYVGGVSATTFIELFKRLRELSEIYVSRSIHKMTTEHLLELIRNAEKLQKCVLDVAPNDFTLDSNTIKKLVEIIDNGVRKRNSTLFCPKHLLKWMYHSTYPQYRAIF